ncbi:hypothetical protein [Roseibacillus ishigakijimensis]|uniref:PpiC domain-containing protein n=1 Tax=Roseibacillus ishigakijimensis TaxID=454146 RepID=A0A934RR49_9BACT|nr:hypothetical protein [Roseibacillus ishigakijimensis]MBK1833529.1 hypothetical protein [Roseibacillus ishigakijimensis]
MLENIRKYTGLFIVVLVLIFVGLVFLQDNMGGSGGPGSGPVVVKTNEKNFSYKDMQNAEQDIRLGQRLIQTSMQNGSFTTYSDISQFLGTLEAGGTSDESLKRYLVHRDHFEKAKAQFGLYPSKEAIDLYQRENIFTDRNGLFDDEGYKDFTEKGLKGLGLTVNDLNDFIGDVLAFQKFSDILSAGVLANETAAKENFIAGSQRFNLSVLSLDLETFKEGLEPSEEGVKTYWQEHRGRYLTEAKRRLTYFTAQPDFDKLLAEKKEAEANREKTPAELAAEAEQEEGEESEEAPAEEVVLTPQERKTAIDELGLEIEENIWVILQGQIESGAEKADLEALAQEYGYEVKTTELLPLSELPEEIRGPVRGSTATVEQELQESLADTGDAMDSLSDILGVGTDSWLLYRVDESVEPTEMTFEEAKESAQADYIAEKAEEALATAIEEAREAVAKALAEETPLNEAAEAQNLKLTNQLEMTAGAPLPGEPDAREVFRLASQTKTGELSDAQVIEPNKNRALFVYVKEREFVESPANEAGLSRAVDQQEQALRAALVQHWFTAQFDAAEVELISLK